MIYRSNVYTPKLPHSYTPFNLRRLNNFYFTIHIAKIRPLSYIFATQRTKEMSFLFDSYTKIACFHLFLLSSHHVSSKKAWKSNLN